MTKKLLLSILEVTCSEKGVLPYGSTIPKWSFFWIVRTATIQCTVKWKDLDICGTKSLTNVVAGEKVYFLNHTQFGKNKTILDIATISSHFSVAVPLHATRLHDVI